MAHDVVPRGLQFAVLRAIPLLGSDACGTEIHAHLERIAGKDIPTAQVYLALQRLKARRLVAVLDVARTQPPAGRRGHPRRIYELTASGLQALEAGMKLFGIIQTAENRKDSDEEWGAGSLIPKPV